MSINSHWRRVRGLTLYDERKGEREARHEPRKTEKSPSQQERNSGRQDGDGYLYRRWPSCHFKRGARPGAAAALKPGFTGSFP